MFRLEVGIYNKTYFSYIIWETRWKVIRQTVRKIPPLDSNLRQSVITFHGGFRDEWRHDRCTNILIFIHGGSCGRYSPLFKRSRIARYVGRVIRTSTSAIYIYVCLFVSCERDGRERQNHGTRYYTPRYVSRRIEAAIIKPSVDVRWVLIIWNLHLPVSWN